MPSETRDFLESWLSALIADPSVPVNQKLRAAELLIVLAGYTLPPEGL